jgi:hypothetical protein
MSDSLTQVLRLCRWGDEWSRLVPLFCLPPLDRAVGVLPHHTPRASSLTSPPPIELA